MKMWRNNPIELKPNCDGWITIAAYKWYKPWTWRNGIKKGEEYIVVYETNFVSPEE